MDVNILVADDDNTSQMILSACLSDAGYNVDTAKDGSEALQKIIDSNNTMEQYDMLITDINMPNMTGLELMDELNLLDLMIPVMAITSATDDKNIIINLLRKGCSEYIPKPFNRDDLLQRTQKILDQKSLKASKKELEIHNRIDHIFITNVSQKMEEQIDVFLKLLMEYMKSDFAVFGSMAPDNHKIKIQTADIKEINQEQGGTPGSFTLKSLGKKCLISKSVLVNNNPDNPPEAFMPAIRFAAVPVFLKTFNGFFIIAGRKTGYTQEDIIILKSVANHITPILDSKSRMDESESQRSIVQSHLEKSNQDLTKLNEELMLGQQLAKNIFSNILAEMPVSSDNINLYLEPMEEVGGDIFLSTPVFHNRQYLILGDFTGHGLAAAIGAVPVSEIFSKINDNSHSIGDIARLINKELKKLLPTGLFLCACMMEIDYEEDIIHIWQGGLPDLLVFDAHGKLKTRVPSRHIPMSIIGDEAFDQTLDLLEVSSGDSIYVFSDGIVEAENVDGDMFGQERLERVISDCPEGVDIIKKTIEHLNLFCKDAPPSDDVTIAQINYQPGKKDVMKKDRITEWKLSWEIGVDILQKATPPYTELLTLCIQPYPELQENKEELFILLAELFTNAFEHGVLNLDADLKKDMATMPLYFTKREEAIANLEAGWINIDIELVKLQGKRQLVFNITDCGSGFDYQNESLLLSENKAPSGRGLPLVQNICEELCFMGRGNKVRAIYSWEDKNNNEE